MMYIFIKKPEIWKTITYPSVKKNSYMISNHGRVYSLITNKLLSPASKSRISFNTMRERAYLQVVLAKDSVIDKQRQYVDVSIHRLVAWEFVPNTNPEKFDFVHHLDNDSLNNYYENLEWCDNQYNQIEARDGGFLNPRKGDEHPNCVYRSELIHEICEKMYIEKLTNVEIRDYIISKYQYADYNIIKLNSLLSHIRKQDRHKDIINKYIKRFND